MNEHKSKHWTIFLPGHTYCYILGLYFRYTNESMSIIWIINSVHSKESQQNCLVQVIQRHKYYGWWLETSAEKLMIKLISLPKEIVHFIPHPPKSYIHNLPTWFFVYFLFWLIHCLCHLLLMNCLGAVAGEKLETRFFLFNIYQLTILITFQEQSAIVI